MPTPSGLPATLREYLDVWCADLLESLSAPHRDQVLSIIEAGYPGGPWPDRLAVQRIAEITAGVINVDAYIGEVTARHGYQTDDAIRLLSSDDPNDHDNAIVLLRRLPDITEVVGKVTMAHRAGIVTDTEFADICSRALRQPLLPEPRPLPPHLSPLPSDYPESYADYRRRNPDFTPADEGPSAG